MALAQPALGFLHRDQRGRVAYAMAIGRMQRDLEQLRGREGVRQRLVTSGGRDIEVRQPVLERMAFGCLKQRRQQKREIQPRL
jgi:hypothetical protein